MNGNDVIGVYKIEITSFINQQHIFSPSQVLQNMLHYDPMTLIGIRLILTYKIHSVCNFQHHTYHCKHKPPIRQNIRYLTHIIPLFKSIRGHLLIKMNSNSNMQLSLFRIQHVKSLQHIFYIQTLGGTYQFPDSIFVKSNLQNIGQISIVIS